MKAAEYQEQANRTSKINWENKHGPDIAILGLIGELGSLASVIKKHQRDKDAYIEYELAFIEELGDVLWYVTTMASRLKISLKEWPSNGRNFTDVFQGIYSLYNRVTLLENEKISLFSPEKINKPYLTGLVDNLVGDLQGMAVLLNTDLGIVAKNNCDKILSYWADLPEMPARHFDKNYPKFEQIPREFAVDFISIEDGKSLLIQMNGINIGDRLTDNNYQDDGYRFHDVFHITGVAMLGWSPVFRRILKKKRKSNAMIDEVEDGARAAIIEEAVINHIYDYARPNFLENVKRVDLDLIKRIQSLVKGYEVSDCEPWEWQEYILRSYEIFRLLIKNGSGRLIINADERSIAYHPLPSKSD